MTLNVKRNEKEAVVEIVGRLDIKIQTFSVYTV